MNKWFKIFIHIFLGLLLGGCVAMVYLCSSESFRLHVAKKVQAQFQKDYQCQLNCHLEKIDWWSLKMVFVNVAISPICTKEANDQGEWSILSEKLIARASWWSLLSRGGLKISLNLDRMVMFEAFENKPTGLVLFCSKLLVMSNSSFISYDSVKIKDGLLYLKKKSDEIDIQLPFLCNIQPEKNRTKIQAYINDGCLQHAGSVVVSGMAGSLVCDFPGVNMLENIGGQVQLNYFVHSLPDSLIKISDLNSKCSKSLKAGFIAGKMEKGAGEFALKSEDGAIIIDPIKIQFLHSQCLCSLGLSASSGLLKYFQIPDALLELSGKAEIELSADLYDPFKTFQLSVSLRDVIYKMKSIFPFGKIFITSQDEGIFSGTIKIDKESLFQVSILFSSDKKDIEINLSNAKDLEIAKDSNWVVKKNKCNFALHYSSGESNSETSGRYDIEVLNIKLDDAKKINGTFCLKDGNVFARGKAQDVEYDGKINLFPEFKIESFAGKRSGKNVFDFKSDKLDQGNIVGKVDFSILQEFVPEAFRVSFAQDGAALISAGIKNGVCSAHVKIEKACMRVPPMYNVIQDLSASCELSLKDKKIVFKDVDISWYEGRASCSRATVYFDNSGNCLFVHAPLLLQDLMFSWDRGVYSLVSGRLLLTKESVEKDFCLEGKLMMQKSELKENIFSCEFQEILSGGLVDKVENSRKDKSNDNQAEFNCLYDIDIFTKESLGVKTSFLSAQAVVDLCLKGCLKKPELSGVILLISGSLFFPYKPLEIVEGKLLFIPEQPFDPIVELVAKGKLKRFAVCMKASGSALDPHVEFESQPSLSEEQIVSLLLLGIENNSLGIMIPAFLIQKLNEIIFGPAMSKIKLKAVFDRLLKSLRYFRFLPQFTNQTGRGGMRGTFEVDASENLHGKIDTNFMQIEDTKFDIDYAATDDITLRLQKDGPSAYGGEVEFRWKFS